MSMLFYLTLLFLVAFSSLGVTYSKNPSIIWGTKYITLSLLIIPAAIRYGIGTDYFSYVDIFNEIKFWGERNIEIGYLMLNKLIIYLNGDVQWVFAICAYATIIFCFKNVSNNRWYIYTILFVLIIYPWLFTTVRQILAASIAFYALRQMEEGHKTIKSILCIALAFLFHISSIIYPFIYFIGKRITIKKTTAIIIFSITFIFTFILSNTLTEYMTLLASLTVYGSYTQSEWFLAADTGSGLGNITRYATFFLLLLLYPLNLKDKNNKLIYNILLVYITFEVMSAQIIIVNRISRGLIFILLPAIYTISTTKSQTKTFANITIYSLLIIYFLAQIINQSPNLMPYKICF